MGNYPVNATTMDHEGSGVAQRAVLKSSSACSEEHTAFIEETCFHWKQWLITDLADRDFHLYKVIINLI